MDLFRRSLFVEWDDLVFSRVQKKVADTLQKMDREELLSRREQLFDAFLDACKRKGAGLFLDIVIESDYNPFAWKEHTVKFPDTVANDPVKRDMRKYGGGWDASASQVPLGKATLEMAHWSKLESTPFFDRVRKQKREKFAATF